MYSFNKYVLSVYHGKAFLEVLEIQYSSTYYIKLAGNN